MDGGINRIERTGPQPAARVRRIELGERGPFTLDGVDGDDERHGGDQEDTRRDDERGDDHGGRPIAPRGEDENGARIDLTA